MRAVGYRNSVRGGVMVHGPENITFSATAAGVMIAIGIAVTLIVYALLTFVALLPTASAPSLVGMNF